jgi:ATP-dependent protease ClpP protease subunit
MKKTNKIEELTNAVNGFGLGFSKPKTLPTVRPLGMKYTLMFDSDIDEPEHYEYFTQVLLAAQEGDVVDIHFNTNGGCVSTLIQLLNYMAECKATINGYLVGTAASAGSFLFLACDEHFVGAHTQMLIHTPSYGTYGKMPDNENYVKHLGENMRKLAEEVYAGFLTEVERYEVIDKGFEMWIDSDEIIRRLEKKQEYQAEQQDKQEDLFSKAIMESFKESLPTVEDLKGVKLTDLKKFVAGDIELEDLLGEDHDFFKRERGEE